MWPLASAPPPPEQPADELPPPYLLLLAFMTHLPFAWTMWVVWRAKAPAALAGVMTAGSLLHGAALHLGSLVPDAGEMLEPALGALAGFHLAFLATFLMACFEELPFDRACALSCPVLLSMLADSLAARDLPGVLLCGLDATCWQLPFERRRKLNNTEELTFKLASNCVLAVGCAVGVHILRSTRAEKLKDE